MLRHFNHKIIAVGIMLSLWMVPLEACGPHFPNRVLLDGDNVVLRAPVANFRKEIERIEPPVPPQFKAVLPGQLDKWRRLFGERDYERQTIVADVCDLQEALAGCNLDQEQCNNIIAKYRSVREVLFASSQVRDSWYSRRGKGAEGDGTPKPELNLPNIPEGLPGEFEDYLRGAIIYHQGEKKKAIDAWFELLRRPAEERLYRSTWAAFMIGKTWLVIQPGQAIEWFRYVRELAEEGFVDSLGLASSSLGWEARAALDLEQYEQAIELYVAQMATGDPTAVTSLQSTACWALTKENPNILAQVAENPTGRKVITAYLISRGGPFHSNPHPDMARKWLGAVETANVDVLEEADRLAWSAYQIGDMKLAQRWLAVALPDATIARWIRAKLLLRAGKVPQAAEQLVHIARRFSQAKKRESYGQFYARAGMNMSVEPIAENVRGELGVLHLAQRQYVEALSVLLQGGHWADSAYVAEYVLTPDELKSYVDSAWPALKSTGNTDTDEIDSEEQDSNWIRKKLRYLLARRLARIGRLQEARPYYPVKWQMRLDAYIEAIQDGGNKHLSNSTRAAALWEAACIARYEGLELLGSEVEPDWFIYGGNFERTAASEIRSLIGWDEIAPSTSDERQRIEEHLTEPDKRFHYRYTAIDHAWQAAELMPDGADETARVLCIAGSWLKVRDPQAADRFYKALVRRCGKTKLGQEADKLRWFPKIKIDRTRLLKEAK